MNPNFKPEMITKKLLKACEEQVQKYFGQREMDGDCEICKALGSDDHGFPNCRRCPLGDGDEWGPPKKSAPCTYDPTYLSAGTFGERLNATKEELLARGNRLIEIFDQHGIKITTRRNDES